MTTSSFIEGLVHIDKIQDTGLYGHFPFQMFVEKKDSNIEMNALALGGDVIACYARAQHYMLLHAKQIFLSLDFPAGGDIPHDFVAIFSIAQGVIEMTAIPYDPVTGEKFPIITKSDMLDKLKHQFTKYVTS